ncbi:hypothetical protein ACIAGK_16935 [Klebsiella quasipneumoniae subsp. similipneumoniae]|uniref:hypothetical protein n=1 Tax=Enterobacterales TaxID=91347 RepID=UPI00065035E9|nr:MULTISPECIES: hypothetical protein [Enterobacterales]AVU37677.1 hypothetical protein AM681_25205 [Serratia marcescens]AVU42762.1 hypothetical protein AS658_24860 [Serratia marcescens]KAA1715785.1 hypothetical protein F1D85_09000 [Klebsiella variicola]MCW7937996.1 hypothetical protein [Klebsiella pneumoniae]MDM9303640.1 hypothetical protein [Klebsiella quasipneumoniae subsp. similipneumoniae]
MKKENRPGQQAANNIDIRGSDVTPPAPTTQAPRRTPKKHRARVYMLRTGVEGWTENDILRYCRLSSGRNYASELERRLDIQLERIDEKNPDGIGSHLRYRFTGRGDVLKVIRLVNHNADVGGYQGLSQPEIADILNLYPDSFTAA